MANYQRFDLTKNMDIYLSKFLVEVDKDPRNIGNLQSKMNELKFQDILGRPSLEESTIKLVLRVYAHDSFINSVLSECTNKYYHMLMDSIFMGHYTNLPGFISKSSSFNSLLIQQQIILIFAQISSRFSQGAKSLPLDYYIKALEKTSNAKNENIQHWIQRIQQQSVITKESGLSTNGRGGEQSIKYQHLEIYPTKDELRSKMPTDLKPLRVGTYPSVEDYVDTQYCLLREDLIHPMREALASYEKGEKSRFFYKNIQFIKTSLPAYIKRRPLVNFTPAFEQVEPRNEHDINKTFPTQLDTLDASQIDALSHCLRSEISLVQGPPGTGKSFIGRKLFELLYDHMERNDGDRKTPILIVCYTNHALDQFVRGVLNITNNVIRLGSRSKDRDLDKYNIRLRISRDHHQRERFTIRDGLTFKLRNLLAEMTKPLGKKDIEDIATYDHFETLHYKGEESYNQWMYSIRKLTKDDGKKCLATGDKQDDVDMEDDEEEDEEIVKNLMAERTFDAQTEERSIDDIDIRLPMWIMKQPSNSHMDNDNIHSLTVSERIELYRHWQQVKLKKSLVELEETKAEYAKLTREILENEDAAYAAALSSADVVAATTTGACRLKKVLESLKARVVIIEEAAEVLESHVVAILPKSVEHLIMIGDHKQLRPSNASFKLAKSFKFDMSLFERIVENGMTYKTLSTQRRMVPNISQFVRPIYDKLDDHPETVTRGATLKIRGMPSNVYFFDHKNAEALNNNTSSVSNSFEADYVIQLASYLLKQGYKPEDIAILTPYTGQLLKIRERKRKLQGLNSKLDQIIVRSVDQFQGEEKDIIILSLVRSNNEKKSGFLAIQNRVNVSLSRARNAMYLIGNATQIVTANELWANLVEILKYEKRFSDSLVLTCENHPDQITTIRKPEDFNDVPEGGCLKKNVPTVVTRVSINVESVVSTKSVKRLCLESYLVDIQKKWPARTRVTSARSSVKKDYNVVTNVQMER
eukprot:gene16310-19398_t